MGLFDGLDNIVDIIDRSWEKGSEKAAEFVDDALDGAGSVAQKLGMDSLAEGLDDLGDQIVSAAGGELEERELGQSKEPNELIRGDPTVITEAAQTLHDMATQISSTGDALRTIDAANWSGAGADGFNAVYDQQPKLWWDSAESFTTAANVLVSWSSAVKTAQDRAADAIAEWERALTEERTKKDHWNSLSGDEQKKKGSLPDTWTALRNNAREILRDARVQRDNAASDVAAKIAAATGKAPTKPPFTSRLSADLTDLMSIADHAALSFESGLLTGLSGIVQFVRSVNPTDTYNVTHPAEYMSAMTDLGTGLVVAASDPGAAVDAMVEEASANPFEFAGALTGDLLVTVATGGAGGAKPVMSAIDKLGDLGRRTNRVTDALPDGGGLGRGNGAEPHGNGPGTHGGGSDTPGNRNAPNGNDAPAPEQPNAGAPHNADPNPQSGIDAEPRPDSPGPDSPAARPDVDQHGRGEQADPDDSAGVDNSPGHENSPRDTTPDPEPSPRTDPVDPDRTDTPPARQDPDGADNPTARPNDDIPPRSETPELPARDTTPDPDTNAGTRDTTPDPSTRDHEPEPANDRPDSNPDTTHDPKPDTTTPGTTPHADTPPAHTNPSADTPHTDSPGSTRDTDTLPTQHNPENSAPTRDPAPRDIDTTPTRTDTDSQNSIPPTTHAGNPSSPNTPTRTPDPANPRTPGRDQDPNHSDKNTDHHDRDTDHHDQDSDRGDQDKQHNDHDPNDRHSPRADDDADTPRARPSPDSDSPDWKGDSRHDSNGDHDQNGEQKPDHRDNSPEHDRPPDHRDKDPDDDSDDHDSDDSPDADDPDPYVDDPDATHDAATDTPAQTDRTPDEVTDCNDPVDAATGEFLLPETDLALPGILSLVLKRRHRSNYRFGKWFGPSWSATLDMRLTVGDKGVTLIGEDGVMLAYPNPDPESPVAPIAGAQQWTLTRTETGGYRVWDPERELIWHFSPDPVRAGLDVLLGNYAISALTDRHRNRIRFHYDADGNPIEITHSGGYRVRITTSHGRVTALAVVDPSSPHSATVIREFNYRTGELTTVASGEGGATHYAYDDQHRMLSWTDSNDNYLVNTYDERGRVIRQRGTSGVIDSEFDYREYPDGTGSLTTYTNSLGARTTHGFDTDLRLRDLLDPVGGRTRLDYNAGRKPLQVIAPDGAATRYTYTDHGDVASITRPDGQTLELEYLFRHRPTRITDVDGTVRHREWDDKGNLAADIDSAAVRTDYTYHLCGAVATITEPNGATTHIEVDAAGLPTRITDPLGAVTTLERDSFGRPTRITDSLGATTENRWSPSGRPLEHTAPDGHTESWTYDGEGNLLTHTNPAGGCTHFTYGAFDLMSSRTDPDGATTTYTWDTERRITGVTNPNGQTWHYRYDPAGRLVSQTDYTGATTEYAHDRTGRTTSITPATGITRHNTHDLLGRLTAVTTDSGDWIRYTHDVAGRLLTATNGNAEKQIHTLDFTYSSTGQLSSQQLDAQPPMLFEHDQQGRRTRRTTPSGAETRWYYDYASRPSGLTADGHDISFTYDPAGRLTRWQLDELAVSNTHNLAGRLLRREVTAYPVRLLNLGFESSSRPGSQSLRTDEYSWRSDGYITSRNTQHQDSHLVVCEYQLDAVGRVATLTRDNAVAEIYTYDSLSNVTSSQVPTIDPASIAEVGSEPVYSPRDLDGFGQREYRNNLLIQDGRTRYHYDESGRLIRKTTTRLSRKTDVWHYRYNSFDQLTDVWTPDGQWWHYTHDALGRRSSKQHRTTDGVAIERVDYVWDGTNLTEQSGREYTTRWHYEPGTHTPLTQTTDQSDIDCEFYAIITDLVGTPTDLIDPTTGRIAGTVTTDLWGQATWRGVAQTPLRFPGQFFDPETGLHYNLHRVYDPATARFLTQDPLGLEPAPNPNVYPHNPTSWIDPLGLIPADCAKAAWADKADFSDQKTLSKKFDAHASDFGVSGNRNKTTLGAFVDAMKAHMTAPDTKIYRFDYRGQGTAVGFIDPNTRVMVMLRSDGKFWSGWELSDKQFSGIVLKGRLW